MIINPTYTSRQFWTTALLSGVLLSVVLSIIYIIFYERLYVESSFLFSILYFIPFVWLSSNTAFFKWKFVYSEFSYGHAFLLNLVCGLVSATLFSGVIYVAYGCLGLESRMKIYDNVENFKELFSPLATSISFFVINVFMTLLYSLIIAIFARKKN